MERSTKRLNSQKWLAEKIILREELGHLPLSLARPLLASLLSRTTARLQEVTPSPDRDRVPKRREIRKNRAKWIWTTKRCRNAHSKSRHHDSWTERKAMRTSVQCKQFPDNSLYVRRMRPKTEIRRPSLFDLGIRRSSRCASPTDRSEQPTECDRSESCDGENREEGEERVGEEEVGCVRCCLRE